mgnify:CR=1 FL=1
MSLLNLLEEFIMFEKIRKMKNKKGFTLVELIVVLVILAILAALLIPALTGYITKANKEKVVAECRMAVMAIQTEATTIYARDGAVTSSALSNDSSAISSLAEVKGTWQATVGADGTVKKVVYTNGGWTVTYSNSGNSTGFGEATSTTTSPATSYGIG